MNTLTYDGDGKRCRIEDSDGLRNLVWDPESIGLETDSGNNMVAAYTSAPRLYGELVSQRRSGATSFHHYDALGSTDRLTDSSQATLAAYLYRAFGQQSVLSGSSAIRFTWVGRLGYYRQPDTANYSLRARVQQPTIGRFLSLDLLRREVNRYLYVKNRPVLIVDPSGRRVCGTDGDLFGIEALLELLGISHPPRCTGCMNSSGYQVYTCGCRESTETEYACSFTSPWPGLPEAPHLPGSKNFEVEDVSCSCNKPVRDDRSCTATFERYSAGVPVESKTVEGHCSLPLVCIYIKNSPWGPFPPVNLNSRPVIEGCLQRWGVSERPPNCETNNPRPASVKAVTESVPFLSGRTNVHVAVSGSLQEAGRLIMSCCRGKDYKGLRAEGTTWRNQITSRGCTDVPSPHCLGLAIDLKPYPRSAAEVPECLQKVLEWTAWLWGPRMREGHRLTFKTDWPHFQQGWCPW